MSGKLIMKRKLDKQQASQSIVEATPRATNNRDSHNRNDDDDDTSSNDSRLISSSHSSSTQATQIKRLRCDTPPPESEDVSAETNQENFVNNQHNHNRLLEAIQSKVLELQQELDAFEQDFETYEDDFYNAPAPAQQYVMSEQEAEALGYAMCAQETMLFLQSEGIPSDSLLYTRLRDALIGTDNDRAFKI